MTCTTFVNTKTNDSGTILDLLKRIDKMQKDAIATNALGTCNSCVIAPLYNTKPIGIYLCNTLLTAITNSGTTVNRFRVEEVKGDVVILRLLPLSGEDLTCSTDTISVKISCICAIQCFDPITCTVTCPLAN